MSGMGNAEAAVACRSAGVSDAGRVRRENEDRYLERPDLGLWVVADGMGGHDAGAYASQAIVDALAAIAPPDNARDLMAAVKQALRTVNTHLVEYAARRGGGSVVASTVVCLLVFGRHYACVWAGDSRLYLLRDGRLRRLSTDHSRVELLVDAGVIDEEEARTHALGNEITRAIGAAETVELDTVQAPLKPGDCFLLCSDGISRMLPDQLVHDLIEPEDPARSVRNLADRALDAGGRDNLTAIVVSCSDAAARP